MDLHVQVSKNNPGVIMQHCTDLEIVFNVTYLFGILQHLKMLILW